METKLRTMEAKEIKIGMRLFHAMFGWCTVTHPVATSTNKVLVNLEADEIEYYQMGKGYATFKRDKSNGKHVLYTPIDELLKNEDAELSDSVAQKKQCLNPKIRFWKLK